LELHLELIKTNRSLLLRAEMAHPKRRLEGGIGFMSECWRSNAEEKVFAHEGRVRFSNRPRGLGHNPKIMTAVIVLLIALWIASRTDDKGKIHWRK
jgi:hypothetical protein